MVDNLANQVERVAEHILERDMRQEDWEKGTAVNGLLTMGEDQYVSAARKHVDYSIATQTNKGKFNHDDPKPWMHGEDPHCAQCEPVTMGHGALEFYERTGEKKYLDAAERQFEYLLNDAKRTSDGGIAYSTGPINLWIDSIYMVCPFFVDYASITGDQRGYDEAVKHIEVQAKHLQDPHTGLFRHEWRETPNTYPESSLWARGNGWAAAGMVDTLCELPEDHPGQETVTEIFHKQVSALPDYQDNSGLWNHILDYPDSPLETSATLQYAYTFKRALEQDILTDTTYKSSAESAMSAAQEMVDDEGRVCRVAVPPGGPDAPLSVTSYGQGWFIMAADYFNE